MPRWKRTRTPRQERRAKQGGNPSEADADVLADPEVPIEVAAEDPVEKENNEVEDAADVIDTAEGEADVVETAEGEGAQGADVNETPRRKSRKRKSRSNRGQPSSTPDNSRKEKRETRIAGVIFMCNAVTKKDCFKYGVFGFPEQKKDITEQVKRGMKLFLYDIDKKHLHGIYEASSGGGMDLVPEAFKDSNRKFPAQVRFRIHKDCMPLAESDFKQAIQDSRGGRFKCELTSEQVGKLMRLFRPLDSEGLPEPRRGRDSRREPASRDARRDLSRDRHARGPARHVPRLPPPVPAREPVYSRESTSLYARERPPIDWDYYRTQPSFLPASHIAVAEADAARRRYLDNLFLEQTNLMAHTPLLHDPLYGGVEYQREMPYSSYVGSRISGFP